MFEEEIVTCGRKVDEEQRLADSAPSLEAGMLHSQMAILYKAELSMLHRRRHIHEQSLRG
jgi:hypothetical protein